MGMKSFMFWGAAASVMPHSDAVMFVAGLSAIEFARELIYDKVATKRERTATGDMQVKRPPPNSLKHLAFKSSLAWGVAPAVLVLATAWNTATNLNEGSGLDALELGARDTYQSIAKPAVEFVRNTGDAIPQNLMGGYFDFLGQDWFNVRVTPVSAIDGITGGSLVQDTEVFARQWEYREQRTLGMIDDFFDPNNQYGSIEDPSN